jgi:hypothetical protein
MLSCRIAIGISFSSRWKCCGRCHFGLHVMMAHAPHAGSFCKCVLGGALPAQKIRWNNQGLSMGRCVGFIELMSVI